MFSVLFISLTLYVVYSSYFFQSYVRMKRIEKNFLPNFLSKVKGSHTQKAYFEPFYMAIKKEDFLQLSNSRKANFSKCYNLVTFKTPDANWELFFYVIKEGLIFREVMTIRIFPKNFKIRSEGSIEKNHSRLNILTNNRYLSNILEAMDSRDTLKWILRKHGDTLYVNNRDLTYKISIESKTLISVDRVMDIIKALNITKSKIYKKDTLEY